MKILSRLSVPVLALLSLSSCALPPREAWRVIRHDGLIPYIAVETGRRPVPRYVHLPAHRGSRFVTLTSSAKTPGSAARGGDVYVMRPPMCLPSSRFLVHEISVAPRTQVVSAPRRPAPRHAHTAVAIAPRLAPHPVAAAPVAKPAPRPIASAPVTRPAPLPPVVTATPPRKPMISEKPKAAAAPTPKPAPPIVAASPRAPAASATTAPSKPAPPAPTKTEPAGVELPYGTLIPGRAGLVNSPYAGKYQLVDVTGLAPGQEVKCPYSGKLFRVPAVQQATNDTKPPAEAPPAPPAKKP